MDDKITGSPEEILARVTAIVREQVPNANCELQDYGHQIGCGELDQWGNVQDVKLRRDHWNEVHVSHAAKVLATKVRTGGSTAG
jgi:hypothetical protein